MAHSAGPAAGAPLLGRRARGVAWLFGVVALAVFLLVLALLSRSAVRYTARVSVDLGPVLRAASRDGAQARTAGTALGRFVAPGALLAQAIGESGFDADLQLGSSSTRISARDSKGQAVESRGHLTIETSADERDKLIVSTTDPSSEQAAARARLAAELIAHRFAELETQAVSKVYEASRQKALLARQSFGAADEHVDRLLSNHFSKLRADLAKSSGEVPAESAADELTAEEERVGDPKVGAGTGGASSTRLAELEKERTELLVKLTPQHPVVRAIDSEIDSIRQQLAKRRGEQPPAAAIAGADDSHETHTDDHKPTAPLGALAEEGAEVLPPWMQVGPGVPAESVPPAVAPPSTVEAPIVAPDEQPKVSLDRSTAEAMETTLAVDGDSLAEARKYLAETDGEYRTAKEARDAAQSELARQTSAERVDWLRLERLEQTSPVLSETRIETAAPQHATRRSIIGLATASALVVGIAAAWGGAIASASFGSIGEVEALTGVPVVGVIETVDATGSRRRKKRVRTWTGRVGLVCELVLVAAIVWLVYLVVSEPGFVENLLKDPFESLVDAAW